MVGIEVTVGATATVTSVSVAPVDWQVLPSLRSAVAQTAVLPAATVVTVVE